MRIIANSRRSAREVMCKKCGTIFECSITDDINKDTILTGKGYTTHYSIKCPACNEKVSLGKDIDEIFPWVVIDPLEYY